MNAPPTRYSHAEASALLPTVREVFRKTRPLHQRLVREARELTQAGVDPFALRAVGPSDLPEKLARRREALHDLARAVDDGLAELADLGVEVKAAEGLADFRSLHEGREVYLCWQWDEPELAWWHELEAGFAGRQPITDPAAFVGEPRH